jgi:monoamine oxidase
MRGYISELLAKAINQNAINASLTTEDKEKLIEFLKTYGDLDPDLFTRVRLDVVMLLIQAVV